MSANYFDRLFNKVLYPDGTPEDAIEFIRLGFLKKEQKDYLGAIEAFSKSIKINPNDGHVYGYRGDVKIEMGDYKGAIDDYSLGKHVSFNRIDFSDQIQIANTKLIHNRIDSYYLNEEANMKTEAVAHFKLGFSGSNKVRIENYNKAILINPNYSNAYKSRGWVKYLEEDYKGAINDYNKAISIFQDPDNFFLRGKMKLLIHEYIDAINDFNRALELYQGCMNYTRIYSLYLRGYANFKLKDFNKALKDIDAALKIDNIEYFNREGFSFGEFEYDSNDVEFNNERYSIIKKDYIGTYAEDLKDTISRFIKLNESINGYIIFKETIPSDLLIDSYSFKLSFKDFHGALNDLSKAIELTPNDFDLYDYRISLNIKLKKYLDALSDLNMLIKRFPDSSFHFFDRGKIKAKLKDFRGAISDLNTFLEKYEEDEAYYERGICKIMIGDRDMGLKDLRKAEELRYYPATKAIKEYFS